MLNRLIKSLQCPQCFGSYQFRQVKTGEIYKTSGVLTCSKCGSSIIAIREMPIFLKVFDNALLAFKVLSRIINEDKTTEPFLTLALGSPWKRIQLSSCQAQPSMQRNFSRFSDLLNFIDDENLKVVFKHFGTDFIKLERFGLIKFQEIHKFLTDEPAQTLLDLGCGFGCSTAPFLISGKAKYCIGVDKSLFFLFLFQKYSQVQGFKNIDLACFDTENQPFPLKSASFKLIMAISFFNHFISTKNRSEVNAFIQELDRLIQSKGRLYIDSVPNRLNPFLGEVNLPGLMRPKIEQVLSNIVHYVPAKWLPKSLSMKLLWHLYKGYCKLTNVKVEQYNIFLSYVSSVIPEIDVTSLPFFPSAYQELLTNFTQTSIIPQSIFYKDFIQRKWILKDFLKSTYLVLYTKKP